MKPQPNQSQAPISSRESAVNAPVAIPSSRATGAPIHMTIDQLKGRLKNLPYNCHEAIRIRAMIYVRRHEQMEREVYGKPVIRVKAGRA